MDVVSLAENLAREAHKGQVDKSGEDYIYHPLYVASQMNSEDEKAVALLHDVVEDTFITLADLAKRGFSKEIIEAVDAITKRTGEDYRTYLGRVKTNPIARVVKIADIYHNMNLKRLKKPKEKDFARMEKYKSALAFLNE